MKQIELYRRLGDYVRMTMEAGEIPVESALGIAYFDCIEGGCDLKQPAFKKVERRKTVRRKPPVQQAKVKIKPSCVRTCYFQSYGECHKSKPCIDQIAA